MACGICTTACPFSCLDLSYFYRDRYNKAYPALERPASCTGCGLCYKSCPVEAIEMTKAEIS